MGAISRPGLVKAGVAAAFAASAALLFVEGDERNGSLAFFLAWAAVHVLYGIFSASFWALLIVVTCPPLFVAAASGSWLAATFVELFYGVPFAFTGVVGRRIWELRRRPALPASEGGEDWPE